MANTAPAQADRPRLPKAKSSPHAPLPAYPAVTGLGPAAKLDVAMARRLAARDASFLITDDPRQPANTEAVLVRDVLAGLDRHLPAHIQRRCYVGGSWFRYLVRGGEAPEDIDPIIFVWTDLAMKDLGSAFKNAMNATLQELLQQARLKRQSGDAAEAASGGRPVECVTYPKGDANAPVLNVRSGIANRHLDVRVVFGNKPAQYFDFLKNAGLIAYPSILDVKKPLELYVPQGFTVADVVNDMDNNVFRSTYNLTGDSIQRVWTELWKGTFPAEGEVQRNAALHATYWAHLRGEAKDDEIKFGHDPKGLPLRVAESTDRVVRNKNVGVLANAVVQLQSYPASEDRDRLLVVVRNTLQSRLGTQAADPLSEGILTLLQSDAAAQTLGAWFHVLTLLHEPSLRVERDPQGSGWMRSHIPVLNGCLTVPGLPAHCNVEQEIARALHTVQQTSHAYGAPFALLAQKYAEQTFDAALATLTNPASSEERRAAWTRCQETLDHSAPAVRKTLTASLAAALPSLVASLHADHYDVCAPVFKHLVGDLGDDAIKACFLLKSILLQARRQHEPLQHEVNRLLAGFGDSAERPHLHTVLQTLLETEGWSKAWSLLGTEKDSWNTVPGAVAAALLDHVNFKLLSSNVDLALALLQRAATTGSPLDGFWLEKRRMNLCTSDAASLHAIAKLIDATPVPASAIVRWQGALKDSPAVLTHVLAESGPHQRTFWAAAGVHLEQTTMRVEHLAFLQDVWKRHRQGGAPDSDEVVSFVVTALDGYCKLPYFADDIGVDAITLRQWNALLERCDRGLRGDAPLILAVALQECGAFVDAAKVLVEESRQLGNRPRNASDIFAGLALGVLEGLIPRGATTVDAEVLPLAEKLIVSTPVESVGHDRRWQEAHGRLFLHFLDKEQPQAAEGVRRRIHTQFAYPEGAEQAVGAMFGAGTPAQRERWGAFNPMRHLKRDLNALRLAEQMLPSRPYDLYNWVAARQTVRYSGPGDRIARALEKCFTDAPDAVEQFHVSMAEAMHAEPTLLQIARSMNLDTPMLRIGMEPMVRAYVATGPANERSERLAQVYGWLGKDFDSPMEAARDLRDLELREMTLHVLASIASLAFAEDKTQALPRFRRLFEHVLATPGGSGRAVTLVSNLEDVIEDPAQKAVTTIRNAVFMARRESLSLAYDMAIRGLLFAHSYVLPRDPRLAADLTLFVLERDEGYRRDQQSALWLAASGVLQAIRNRVHPSQRTEAVFERLAQVEREKRLPALAVRSSNGGEFAHTQLQAELIDHVHHLLRSPSTRDFCQGLDLIFDDAGVFDSLPRGPRSAKLMKSLQRGLATSEHREALRQRTVAWSDLFQGVNSPASLQIMQMIVLAQCGTYVLDGEDVASYLEVLCARRAASRMPNPFQLTGATVTPSRGDEWLPLMQKVISAAQAGCFRPDVWSDAARVKTLKERVGSRDVQLALDRLS